MHGDPQHGGRERTVSIGDLELTSIDHEAQEAQQQESEDAQGQGLRLRQQEDERRGHDDPAGFGNAGDDAGGLGGHDSGLLGPADVNGGEGFDGAGGYTQPAQMQLFGDRGEPAEDQITDPNKIDVFHIPPEALAKALELGAGQGVEKVILATDDETIAQVQDDLLSGKKQFWAATQHGEFVGCLISEGRSTATGMVLDLPYMAGRRPQDWLPLMTDLIEPMAIEAGYEAVETSTREGMRKFLIGLGWRKTYIRMRRDFNGQKDKGR